MPEMCSKNYIFFPIITITLIAQPMHYTGTARVCMQNFAAVRRAVSQEIANTRLRVFIPVT